MPLINVNEIIEDLDFSDATLVCERNSQSIGKDGLAIITPRLTPFSGVVTSMGGQELVREAAGEAIKQRISIVTTFFLQSGAPGFTADIVQWNGGRYTIIQVDDYSMFGNGFVQAIGEVISRAG